MVFSNLIFLYLFLPLSVILTLSMFKWRIILTIMDSDSDNCNCDRSNMINGGISIPRRGMGVLFCAYFSVTKNTAEVIF